MAVCFKAKVKNINKWYRKGAISSLLKNKQTHTCLFIEDVLMVSLSLTLSPESLTGAIFFFSKKKEKKKRKDIYQRGTLT